MGEYTVRISSPNLDFVFAADVDWRDPERIYRRGVLPNVLVAIVREIELTLEIPDDTPTLVRAAFSSFMSTYISSRTVPDTIQIRDPGGTPIPDLGIITSTGGPPPDWEDVQIVSFDATSADPGQFRARAVFTMVFRGRKIFPDSNAFAEFDQVLSREAGDGGEQTVETRLESTVRMTSGNDVQDQAALLRLAAPPGTIRIAPANRTSGISINYPNWPRTDQAVVVSIIRELADGVVLPAGAGAGTLINRVADDPGLGLTRNTLRAEVSGTGDPLGFVDNNRPPGVQDNTEHDRANATASGEWETREAIRVVKDKVIALRVTWTLQEGGRGVQHSLVTGGFKWLPRKGPFAPFLLTETVEAFALGPTVLDEVPMPDKLKAPWLFRPAPSTWSPPLIQEYGDRLTGTTQHFWKTSMTRSYLWDSIDDPRSVDQNKLHWMDQFLAGATARQLRTVDLVNG